MGVEMVASAAVNRQGGGASGEERGGAGRCYVGLGQWCGGRVRAV